jgi:translin
MSFSSVESSLNAISGHLDSVNSRRERLIKESREIISLCSRTIIAVHTSNVPEGRRLFDEAKSKLRELRRVADADLLRYILTPEQELVEASVMLSMAESKPPASMQKLGVAASSYILGLLDSIGEMKRLVYDKIRKNELAEAENKFEAMESLFVLLSPFAVYDNIVPGLRRKLDVARILIEDARSAVTEESRRGVFMASIAKLSDKLNVTGSSPAE